MKRIRKILLCALVFSSPVVLDTVGGPISFSEAVYAEEKKRKTRRVPALREKTYKLLSEAQIMIDPESVPREEGEPAPVPKGTPADAVRMLQKALTQKGVNSYETAQIWNTLAFAYYTLEDTPQMDLEPRLREGLDSGRERRDAELVPGYLVIVVPVQGR